MLGRFSRGMAVKIPANFRDRDKQAVEMENVVVGIQHFDSNHRTMEHVLKETPMQKIGTGHYYYEYVIPPTAPDGNYVVHIKAKQPGNLSRVPETTTTFEVDGSSESVKNAVKEPPPIKTESTFEEPKEEVEEFDINSFKIDQPKGQGDGSVRLIEDLCVDVYNKPVKGVHINVYDKNGFVPGDKTGNNMKVGSAMSNDEGEWKLALPPGEYVFEYKAVGLRLNREFRKV